MVELAAEVRAMWPGCSAEVYRHRPTDPVTVVAWWGDYHTGALVRRTLPVR